MNIIKSIETAVDKKAKRGYEYLYWCIDLHGVILEPTYSLNNDGAKPYDYALQTLRAISSNPSNKIILWTSSYEHVVDSILEWLKRNEIRIDYFNENPDFIETDICDFTTKWFFDILLDDKAGFEPEKDWLEIYNYLKKTKIEVTEACKKCGFYTKKAGDAFYLCHVKGWCAAYEK